MDSAGHGARPAAIVTGVSRGLGAALAAELIEREFTVLGIGRASHPGLVDERYRFLRFDLTDAAGVDDAISPAFEALLESSPAFVCLVNNAATAVPIGTLGQLLAPDIASAILVNLAAPVALANLFCRVFTNADMPCRLINVSSGAADVALPGDAVYCVAKAGIEMLTRALSAEHRAPGFRAITLRPGVMDTQMQAFSRAQSPETLPNVEMFKAFHREGRLIAPAVVARKLVDRLVAGEVEHGRTYTYQEL